MTFFCCCHAHMLPAGPSAHTICMATAQASLPLCRWHSQPTFSWWITCATQQTGCGITV
jgi:hypothetical protein